MKKMSVLMGLFLVAQLSFAQSEKSVEADKKIADTSGRAGKGHHGMHKRDKRAMMKELNLSEDQKTKLKEMNAGNKEKKQAVMNNAQLTEEQKKEQLTTIRKEQAANLNSVLTDEQKVKMKEVRKHMKEGRKHGKKQSNAQAAQVPEAPKNQ